MINFQTDLISNNPAYNDSIIRYSSTLTGMTKSDILIDNVIFSVYPYQNVFSFNFKEIIKARINTNGFEDMILPDLSSNFIYPDTTLQTTISPIFSVYNDVTGETTSKNYLFTKRVEQLPFYNQKIKSNNDVIVCLPTTNNFDYQVSFFEGYPFDFAIQGLKSGDTYHFVNSNSGLISNTYTAATSDVIRVFISDGANNTTFDNTLVLSSNLNQLELWVNGVQKANINLNKVESKCGIYFKWFNSFGAYSYWLFEPIYKESIKIKQMDEIAGKWENLQNLTSDTELLGKTSIKTLAIQSNFNQNEKEYLIDILNSPKVVLFINQQPFIKQKQYDFIGVKATDGTFQFNNKGNMNQLKLSIELPNTNTITY
jgi:hypothetical protein